MTVPQIHPLEHCEVINPATGDKHHCHIVQGAMRYWVSDYSSVELDVFNPSVEFINGENDYPYFILEDNCGNDYLVSVEDIFDKWHTYYPVIRYCDGNEITVVDEDTMDDLRIIRNRLLPYDDSVMVTNFVKEYTLLGAVAYVDKPLWADDMADRVFVDEHTATLEMIRGRKLTKV